MKNLIAILLLTFSLSAFAQTENKCTSDSQIADKGYYEIHYKGEYIDRFAKENKAVLKGKEVSELNDGDVVEMIRPKAEITSKINCEGVVSVEKETYKEFYTIDNPNTVNSLDAKGFLQDYQFVIINYSTKGKTSFPQILNAEKLYNVPFSTNENYKLIIEKTEESINYFFVKWNFK